MSNQEKEKHLNVKKACKSRCNFVEFSTCDIFKDYIDEDDEDQVCKMRLDLQDEKNENHKQRLMMEASNNRTESTA